MGMTQVHIAAFCVAFGAEFVSVAIVAFAMGRWRGPPFPELGRQTRVKLIALHYVLTAVVSIFAVVTTVLFFVDPLPDAAITATYYMSGITMLSCVIQSTVVIYLNTCGYHKYRLAAAAKRHAGASDAENGYLMSGSASDHDDSGSGDQDDSASDANDDGADDLEQTPMLQIATGQGPGSDDDAEV